MKPQSILAFFSLSLIFLGLATFTSCSNEEPPSPSPFILEEDLLACNKNAWTIEDIDFQVNHIYEFADHVFLGGFDHLLIYSPSQTISKAGFAVNGFIEYNSQLLVYNEEGIYEVNAAGDTDLLVGNTRCTSMMVSSNNELLFTTLGNGDFEVGKIYQLDPSQGPVVYADANPISKCITIQSLVEASNGDIWASTCDGTLVRYRNKQYVDYFNETNSPLRTNGIVNKLFILPFSDDMVVVQKNGIGPYQVLKFNEEDWITLFDFQYDTLNTDQDIEMSLPSLTEAKIYHEKLYVATTLASCRGFQVFDISKNELLEATDYYIVKDPGFESQCIDAFQVGPDEQAYVVTDNQLTIFTCN